jgi:hypothetical protein
VNLNFIINRFSNPYNPSAVFGLFLVFGICICTVSTVQPGLIFTKEVYQSGVRCWSISTTAAFVDISYLRLVAEDKVIVVGSADVRHVEL